jgi:hypothetical protein
VNVVEEDGAPKQESENEVEGAYEAGQATRSARVTTFWIVAALGAWALGAGLVWILILSGSPGERGVEELERRTDEREDNR